jgi:hypothetical protein
MGNLRSARNHPEFPRTLREFDRRESCHGPPVCFLPPVPRPPSHSSPGMTDQEPKINGKIQPHQKAVRTATVRERPAAILRHQADDSVDVRSPHRENKATTAAHDTNNRPLLPPGEGGRRPDEGCFERRARNPTNQPRAPDPHPLTRPLPRPASPEGRGEHDRYGPDSHPEAVRKFGIAFYPRSARDFSACAVTLAQCANR